MNWMWLFILESVSVLGDHRSLLWAVQCCTVFERIKVGKMAGRKEGHMNAIPELTDKGNEALDTLVDLLRQSKKNDSVARTTILAVALYLAQTSVLEYLVTALLTQAQTFVKGGVKLDHWGGAKLGQGSGWKIGVYGGVWRLERRPAVRLCGPRLGRSGRRRTPRGVLPRGAWRGFSGQVASCVCACSA